MEEEELIDWYALPGENGDPTTWEVQEDGGYCNRIARVYGNTAGEAQARATLLAASQDLLLAAKLARDVFGAKKLTPPYSELDGIHFQVILHLTAAIAKATGKEQA